MKRGLALSLAALVGGAAVLGVTACGEKKEPVKVDREAPAFSDAQATFRVNAQVDKNSEQNVISKSLFGVFLEDINYASYAMDDNLVANGGFEGLTASKNYAWSAAEGATLQIASEGGVFEGTVYDTQAQSVNPDYAKVTVPAAGGKLKNSGYTAVPMAVKSGADYVFSAFLKTDAAVDLTVSVTDGTTVYASTTFNVAQDESWVKYTRTLRATASASENLYLEISFGGAATVCLDAVSLETTESTLGIKNYIYEAIRDLSPKFIRFPGGCVIEGTGMQNAYDWKNSVGAVKTGANAGDDTVPAFSYKVNTDGTTKEGEATYGEPATRTRNADIWAGENYYDMEYAIGFYEYFLLCESVGASAVPVLNCGLSDMGGLGGGKWGPLEGRHNKGIEDYIRDAVDLIEFAKGDTTTKWGKIRADMGHPAPFEMDYLGIGNEQSGTYYKNYYEKFLANEAFKTALGTYGIKPIVGNAMTLENCYNPLRDPNKKGTAQQAAEECFAAGGVSSVSEYGVHDQHYYVNYLDLLSNAAMYDGYTRSYIEPDYYYEVFVGEYSANSYTSGGIAYAGNSELANCWITALSEAAMMTGYERNGDVVKLAAYAPMFGAADHALNQWSVDMMYYTNTALLRSANYYVQQLFMKNQGAYRLTQSEMSYAADFEHTFEMTSELSGGNTRKAEVEKLYSVASMAENGDIIVKLVNASGEKVRTNIEFENAALQGVADVTELHSDDKKAKNSLEETKISPESFTIGSNGAYGYELQPYSVVAIRFRAK